MEGHCHSTGRRRVGRDEGHYPESQLFRGVAFPGRRSVHEVVSKLAPRAHVFAVKCTVCPARIPPDGAFALPVARCNSPPKKKGEHDRSPPLRSENEPRTNQERSEDEAWAGVSLCPSHDRQKGSKISATLTLLPGGGIPSELLRVILSSNSTRPAEQDTHEGKRKAARSERSVARGAAEHGTGMGSPSCRGKMFHGAGGTRSTIFYVSESGL